MNPTLKALRLMTHVNIGATLALLAWLAPYVLEHRHAAGAADQYRAPIHGDAK